MSLWSRWRLLTHYVKPGLTAVHQATETLSRSPTGTARILRKPAIHRGDPGCRGWFVLVMGGTPLSVRVRRVTAPEPLIYYQEIADQPVCI
jgi:hypothetical protein